MRALGYFRGDVLSRQGQDRGDLSDLEDDFAEFCDLNLHQPIETFGDTGASDDGGYPEYRRLLSYIRESGSNFLVAIPDSTHLGSDIESFVRAFLEVEGVGAKVTCQDEDAPDPLQSALAILGVSGVSKSRSSKIRESMQNKAILGKALGRPPFGYSNADDGTLEVVEDEAVVVRLIFKLYTEDRLGMRRIVQELNTRGLRTRRGGNWNVVSIRDILKNSVYIGTYSRFGLRLPRAHQPIVTPDVYRAARDIVRERRPRDRLSKAEPYLLSGIVFCDYCGNRMMGVTRRQQWSNKDGTRNRSTYRYYQCQSRNNQSVCGYHTWRETELERAVVAQIPSALERKAGDGPDDGDREQVRARMREEKVRNAERRFHLALRKTAAGAADTDHLQKAVTEMDDARSGAKTFKNVPDAEESLRRWEELEFEEKRDFLLTHVTRVDVRDHGAWVTV